MIDRYIHFYNHERIQLKTGEAPLARRLSGTVMTCIPVSREVLRRLSLST